MPLQTKFMAQLDRYSADLTKLFSKRGGTAGKKIRRIMERTPQVYELCHLVVDTVRAEPVQTWNTEGKVGVKMPRYVCCTKTGRHLNNKNNQSLKGNQQSMNQNN